LRILRLSFLALLTLVPFAHASGTRVLDGAQITNGSATITLPTTTGTLALTTFNKENLTLNGTDISNQFKDLAQLITPNSLTVSVLGVIYYEGLDYTLSTVSLVTRVTFAGALATGGTTSGVSSELISGDILRVQYKY